MSAPADASTISVPIHPNQVSVGQVAQNGPNIDFESSLAITSTPYVASVAIMIPIAQANPAGESFPWIKLPPELQKDILDLICNFVRVIKIHEDDTVHFKTIGQRHRVWRNYTAKATCTTGRLPVVIQVNKQFRQHALQKGKFYKRAFQNRLRQKHIYMNFAVDVLYIPNVEAWKSLTSSRERPFPGFINRVSKMVKHLVIKGAITAKMEEFLKKAFGQLETLVLETNGANADSIISAALHEAWEALSKADDPAAQVKFPRIEFMSHFRIQVTYGN